jgi:hypothetical protein
MNISKETIKKLELDYYINLFDDQINNVSPEDAISIHIAWEKTEGGEIGYIGKTFKAPKKAEVTYQWVLEKLNKQNVFVNFCEQFNSFLKTKGLRGYATTYGIGVESLWVSSKNLKENQASIENELDSLGIKYTTEYSEAHWVFRYKISQSKENIEVLTNASKPVIGSFNKVGDLA